MFLTSFLFLFYQSMVSKKIVKFLGCFIVLIRDFIKKLRYLKSKISKKFRSLLFLFYFFSIFGIFFSISPFQTCLKIMKFFVVFYIRRVRDFTNDLWKILKVLFKKILICEILFFKIWGFTICFLFFLLFLTF